MIVIRSVVVLNAQVFSASNSLLLLARVGWNLVAIVAVSVALHTSKIPSSQRPDWIGLVVRQAEASKRLQTQAHHGPPDENQVPLA